MYRYYFLLFLASNAVIGEDCVTVNFENGFEDDFTNTVGVCIGMPKWSVKQYSSLNTSSPHPRSTNFIRPQSTISCISSFKFRFTAGGLIEVNLYMAPTVPTREQVTMIVFQYVPGGSDTTRTMVVLNPAIPGFLPGWKNTRIIIPGAGSFDGYITFLGTADSNSNIFIDSFRYIPPSLDEEYCVIYKDEVTTTIASTTTDDLTTTEKLTITEAETSTEEPTTTKVLTTSEEPIITDESSTAEVLTTTEVPNTSQEPITTEMPSTAQGPSTTVEPSTTEVLTTSEEPNITIEPSTAEVFTTSTTDVPTTAIEPSTFEVLTTTKAPTTTVDPSTTEVVTTTEMSTTIDPIITTTTESSIITESPIITTTTNKMSSVRPTTTPCNTRPPRLSKLSFMLLKIDKKFN